jgi:hypothetical protein
VGCRFLFVRPIETVSVQTLDEPAALVHR